MLPYCWNDETPLSSHELRMDDDVYQSRQDPAITVGLPGHRRRERARGRLPVGLDDDAVDAAVATRRSRSNPDVDLRPGAGSGRPALPARRRRGWRPTPANSAKNPKILATYTGRDLLGTRYLPPFPYFMDAPNVVSGAARRLRHHRGRHRHRAHVAGLRRGRHGDQRRRRASSPSHRSTQGPFRRDRAGLRRPACLRRQPADHPRPEEPGSVGGRQRCGAAAPRDLRALLPALLALPKPVDLPGGFVVVHQGHRVPRPHGRTQPGDHLVSRARQGRPVRQVAAGRPRLVDLPKPVLGHARFRCGSPTTPRIRASTSTAASTSWSATSVCARRICTGPTSTS